MCANSLTGNALLVLPCWNVATVTMCRSQVKFVESFVEKKASFSAKTEKLPSESPFESIRMFDPVMPANRNISSKSALWRLIWIFYFDKFCSEWSHRWLPFHCWRLLLSLHRLTVALPSWAVGATRAHTTGLSRTSMRRRLKRISQTACWERTALRTRTVVSCCTFELCPWTLRIWWRAAWRRRREDCELAWWSLQSPDMTYTC